MKILAIDSSSVVASVALFDGVKIIGEYSLQCGHTHSATLMPLIENLFKMTHTPLAEIEAIAITEGPGSFTGLRIGASTAKGMALALNIPLIPISTLETLAWNVEYYSHLICPIMDAKRNEVYTSVYRFNQHKLEQVLEIQPMQIDTLIQWLNQRNEKVIFLGDGVPVYKSTILNNCDLAYFASEAHLTQRAGALISAALHYLESNEPISADVFAPVYFRKSQAERELANK